MGLRFAKRGSRPTDVTVKIYERAKVLSFSSGFIRKHFKDNRPGFIKEGFDDAENKIAIQFIFDVKDRLEDKELVTLTYNKNKTAASAVIRPVLTEFQIDIKDVYGTYENSAIEGPVSVLVDGDTRSVFLLSVDKRTVNK